VSHALDQSERNTVGGRVVLPDSRTLLRHCSTDEERFAVLADAYQDTKVWRLEESDELAHLRRRIEALERGER